ncbi:MAG: WecB/TagA/CpsF family glycosyltransferase, partial [Gammaproteobacteria bacterium]
MSLDARRKGTDILGAHIDAISWEESLTRIANWALANESRYVCICNVHSVVTARRSPEFCNILNEADLATPDGMPLAWCLRHSGFSQQPRINGPDLFWKLCRYCARHGVAIFLYGGTDRTLALLRSRIAEALPELPLAGSYSPPFRELTKREEQEIAARISASGARIVFVGLGCPKQEFWMARHRGRLKAVLIGVGAAFDFHAGVLTRA